MIQINFQRLEISRKTTPFPPSQFGPIQTMPISLYKTIVEAQMVLNHRDK